MGTIHRLWNIGAWASRGPGGFTETGKGSSTGDSVCEHQEYAGGCVSTEVAAIPIPWKVFVEYVGAGGGVGEGY